MNPLALRTGAGALLVLATLPAPVIAQKATPSQTSGVASAPVTVRVEDHTNFGRIALEADGKALYRLERTGDRVQIRFEPGTRFSSPPAPPRNVLAMTARGAILELTLAHGAAVHPLRTGGHILFDIVDAPPAVQKPAPPPRLPQPKGAPATAALRMMATSPELGGRSVAAASVAVAQAAAPQTDRTADQTATKAAAPAPQPEAPSAQPNNTRAAPSATADTAMPSPTVDERAPDTGRDLLPEPIPPGTAVARRVRLPPDIRGSAVLLPFDDRDGAAAFTVSDGVVVVFDRRQAVSMTLLRDDPVFRRLDTTLLPAGTSFHLPIPAGQTFNLALSSHGWRLFVQPTSPRCQGIDPETKGGELDLPLDRPGHVVSLTDPDTGAPLLVGTQRRPGQAVTLRRRTPQFILRPTLQGVVVEPLADTLQMQTTPQGFALTSSSGPLGLSPITPALQAKIDAARLTRRIDLPALRTETLRRRLAEQLLEAGATPPLSRGPRQRAVAKTLLALGFAAEADGLLLDSARLDPREATLPDTEALTAIAAILAGRPNEASGLNDPRLDGTDDIDFWRAIRQAMTDAGSPAAAAVLATTGPLVLSYPRPITEHLLPLVVETMLEGGEIPPAARLMDARPHDPRLAYARALRKEVNGDTAGALADLDRLSQVRDQFDSSRAAVQAVELRLTSGRIDKGQAADALDRLLITWRGDERELAVRERIAALRAETGAWPTGLAILRQARKDFPEHATAISQRLADMFGAMLRDTGTSRMSPLDFVATVDENADLMHHYDNDATVQQALLDRLMALDLPDRAIPILRRLLAGARTDVARARYGESLASLQAHEGLNADAIATLDSTETEAAPEHLAETRILTRAEAMAGKGDRAGAVALLLRLATPAAAAKRAELQEAAGDWSAAESAWRDAVASSPIPPSGLVDAAASHLLVRLATAAAQAGDNAGLAELRTAWATRLPRGPEANAFDLLTSPPIRNADDLQRSAQEVGLAASVAAGKLDAGKGKP